jgi:hypothetical protein
MKIEEAGLPEMQRSGERRRRKSTVDEWKRRRHDRSEIKMKIARAEPPEK